jgi:hypothetical protein
MSQTIEPMAAGEKPTEPGWYVAEYAGEEEPFGRQPVQVTMCSEGWPPRNHQLGVLGLSHTGWLAIDDTDITFIARIYPDRIEGREGWPTSAT